MFYYYMMLSASYLRCHLQNAMMRLRFDVGVYYKFIFECAISWKSSVMPNRALIRNFNIFLRYLMVYCKDNFEIFMISTLFCTYLIIFCTMSCEVLWFSIRFRFQSYHKVNIWDKKLMSF